MAKVVVTLNGQVQQEVALLKSRLKVGRRPGNDLVLDHLTVSGQHAAIDPVFKIVDGLIFHTVTNNL